MTLQTLQCCPGGAEGLLAVSVGGNGSRKLETVSADTSFKTFCCKWE